MRGEIKLIQKIGAAILFLLFLLNLMNQFKLNEVLSNRLEYTLLYLFLSIFMYFFDFKLSIVIVLFVIGIHNIIDDPNPSSLSGLVFFTLAYFGAKNYKWMITANIIMISSVIHRSTKYNDTIPQAMAIVMAYIGLYFLFYWLVNHTVENPIAKRLKKLTKQENKLLELMSQGKHQGTAGKMVAGWDKYETSRVIRGIREKLELTSEESNTKINTIYITKGK